jgi:hypothetical protein
MVARLLRDQLDGDWTVFHSYPWLTRRQGQLKQGESDFILLHPKGLLVLEVKGGRIHYNADTREWRQNHHWMKDPFAQAGSGMHNLMAQIGGSDFVRGYAVAFPECKFVGSLPPGVVRSTLLDAEDLNSLASRLAQLLSEWGEGRPLPTRAESERIRKALLPRCQLIPDLRHAVSDEERVLHTLTHVQVDTLAGLFSMDRVLIQGVAGSGKTLLAVQRAMDLAQQGLRTLFLCYNKNLAQDLRSNQQQENLEFSTFHELCHRFCQQAGLPFEVGADPDWWDTMPPELLLKALELRQDLRYDAMLVDEGQDFRSTWWVAALSLLHSDDAPCYIFFDPEQNLYKTEVDLPNFPGKFVLRQNCRNTQKIARSCRRLQPGKETVPSHAPEGRDPQVEVVANPLDALKRVREHLGELVSSLTPQAVAVLSPYSRTKSICSDLEALTTDFSAWRRGEAPLFSTIRGFKGLEAQAVLLVDVPEFDEKAASKTDVYVALTRAKNELRIITTNSGLSELLGV